MTTDWLIWLIALISLVDIDIDIKPVLAQPWFLILSVFLISPASALFAVAGDVLLISPSWYSQPTCTLCRQTPTLTSSSPSQELSLSSSQLLSFSLMASRHLQYSVVHPPSSRVLSVSPDIKVSDKCGIEEGPDGGGVDPSGVHLCWDIDPLVVFAPPRHLHGEAGRRVPLQHHSSDHFESFEC